ncbi:DUF1538 domain-containing protein [Miniphocaeibacter massiliensis]|uniref:DUF1538 domain-containing protein n=1 Tax=Miniphocaeibacter massiliensis TaxID=2041841 RepID=UPI000C1C4D37|nr:DUF1538 domain-containing protein [Miniphocaeibacter massiliensis]
MKILQDKIKEVSLSVLPITLIVTILNFTLAPVDIDLYIRFLLGAIIIILGLGVFLWGAEIGVSEIGTVMGEYVAKSKTIFKVLGLGFILGFLITVAEPDLLILANQVSSAMGGTIAPNLIVGVVSVGVGSMIAIGFLRILFRVKFSYIFSFIYLLIFIIFAFISEEFQAIAFDASGATTGAMTTPFILAMGLGVSKLKGSSVSEEDSFGLVGMASTGPILAVMILSLVMGADKIQGTAEKFEPVRGIISPIMQTFKHTIPESLIALLPIALLFILMNFTIFKLKKREFIRIIIGLFYTYLGLVLFLNGVNAGFLDVARLMGQKMASIESQIILPVLGIIIGMVVVLAEPAVYVLSSQVEDVTSGYIPRKIILATLSIGVAVAVCLSMLRIVIPELKIWMLLVPGFVIAIILSYFTPPLFVGIAFDSGGVASGPMTATFVLALTQGAADATSTADVLRDGFGVIAMVAMVPIIAIMILGLLFKLKTKKEGIKNV